MNINYEAYRVFYYTAKTRSFTQAANALGNSQPNITRIIKNLERELGCTLFLRNNRHVELTAEGETLYRHVSAAFEQLQAGEEAPPPFEFLLNRFFSFPADAASCS